MLMVLSRNPRSNLHLVCRIASLARCEAVCVHDAGSLNLELDGAVESEVEVEAVLPS
jgi:hypothetical protein